MKPRTLRSARPCRPVKNVLVIGGAGYIGSILVRRLLDDGFKVRVLDSCDFGEASIASLFHHPRFELLRADFRDVDSVVRAVQGTDAVIHLGAIVGDPACKLDSELTIETNLEATSMIRSVCHGAGIARFLFASTCSVYGASQYLLDEKSAVAPISLYACTKLDSERVILTERSPDFAPTVLRLGTAFGWSCRPRFDLVVNQMTARAFFERRITVFNQSQWRPFVSVDDIARAFMACLTVPTPLVAYEIFNVGSNRMNATLGELASLVANQIPGTQIEYVDKAADHRNYRVCFDKISTTLGFTCSRSLEDGISEIKKAIENKMVANYLDAIYHNDQILQQINIGAVALKKDGLLSISERFLRGEVFSPQLVPDPHRPSGE
jgi:nucleoside-diphosphate-sugar epimerase